MDFYTFLLLISVPGFLGGMVSALRDNFQPADSEEDEKIKIAPDCQECGTHYLLSRGLIGVAGAFGVILLSHWIGQIKADENTINKIFIVSLSMIGGTISFRVLASIGNILADELLERKVKQTDQTAHSALSEAKIAANSANIALDQAREAVKEAQAAAKEAILTKSYSSAIAKADTALSRKEYNDRPQAIETLESIRQQFPFDRTLHIYLGRLYRGEENYDDAIKVLRNFTTNLTTCENNKLSESRKKVDLSDAHYNISCYHVLKAENLKNNIGDSVEFEINRIINEALEDLKISIHLWDDNRNYAAKDPDFNFIKGDQRFLDLLFLESTNTSGT